MTCYHPNIIYYKTNAITKKDGTPGTDIQFQSSKNKNFKGYKYYLKLHEEIQK